MNRQDAAWRRAVECRGFSLLEVIVAVGLLSGACAALVQLFVFAARANVAARATTLSMVLAAQKIEQLRARPDVDIASPGGLMGADLQNFADYFDGLGQVLAAGPPRPPATAFVRRWSIEPLPSEPLRSRVLRVRVLQVVEARPTEPPWPARQPHESRLLTVVTGTDR